jgi:hypothetical protein
MAKLKFVVILLLASALLTSCKRTNDEVKFSNDESSEDIILADPLAKASIDFSKSQNLNQEFKVTYKTKNPDGQGEAAFKARSIKPIDEIDGRKPNEGKKLILVEISVQGKSTNKGSPSSFNQIGDTPSPQFVMINKKDNRSEVETTYYSDAYTQAKKLFELSKITLDHEKWVDTALVFEIDAAWQPDLAFRFTNPSGKTEFYDITE